MARKRNNSFFGGYAPPENLNAVRITRFEKRCIDLDLLSYEQQLFSPSLKAWVKMYMKLYYVPERLLKAWGFQPYVDVD